MHRIITTIFRHTTLTTVNKGKQLNNNFSNLPKLLGIYDFSTVVSRKAPISLVHSPNMIYKTSWGSLHCFAWSERRKLFLLLKLFVFICYYSLTHISQTTKAIERLKELQKEDHQTLKVGVKNKGCSGLGYNLTYVKSAEKFDEIVEQDGNDEVLIGSSIEWSKYT